MIDTALAAVPCALGLSATRPFPSVQTVVAVGVCVPLIWRRRFPVAVLLWVYAVGLAQLVFGARAKLSDLAIIIMVYTISVYGPRWAIAMAVSGGVLGGVLAVLQWSHAGNVENRLLGMGVAVTPVLMAWTVGLTMRTRRAYLAELEQRAVRLERERDARRAARTSVIAGLTAE